MKVADADIVTKLWEKPTAFYWRMSQKFDSFSNSALPTDPTSHVLEGSVPRNPWRYVYWMYNILQTRGGQKRVSGALNSNKSAKGINPDRKLSSRFSNLPIRK
jgi:hypothetical protein